MTCANHPDRERSAFCQHCGKPICQECTRTAGNAVFCEPCLAVRIAGQAPGGYPLNPNFPPPSRPGEPSPGLAGVLGLIPGVGAVYNRQYGKGMVHLVVFALLVSLASHADGIFVLFVIGWVFYQVIEAHQTARARRDGTPLPNPFGLNDLEERLGFGSAWPSGNAEKEPVQTPPPPPPPTAQTGAPPNMPPYTYDYNYPFAPVPSMNPNDPSQWPDDRLPKHTGFPTAAIWLIALGVIFLLGNFSILPHFYTRHFVPLFLIGFGIWVFFRAHHTLGQNGEGLDPRLRLFWAAKGAVWIILIGVLFLLNSLGILTWTRSWPLFWIVGGVMLLARRVAYSGVTPTYPYGRQPPAAPPAQPGTAIVPTTHKDEEF